MNQGRLEQIGTPEEIYLKPQTRFVASFLGAVNWIGGVGVRPEAMRIAREPSLNGGRSHPATIVHSTFLGNCVHVDTRLSDGEPAVVEISRLGEAFAAGERVHLWWEPSDELRFE